MTRAGALAAALLVGAVLPAWAGETAPAPPADTARATEPALQPYVAIRSLQALQDQVAHGGKAAQAAQPALLAHIGEIFQSAGPAAWKDRRNAEAAALYLFSAGRPAAVRAAIAGVALSPDDDRLIKGALAYAEGDDEAARAALGTLEPRTLPRGLGGHLALVLASLYADKDPRKAGQMLDQARLLVPGTLVEEAALRRQIFLLAQPATIDRFAALSRQYLRRFHASVFAGNFKARLRSFAASVAVAGDAAQFAVFDPVFADLPQAEARGLYLSLARDALVAGRMETAHDAAAKAIALSPAPAESMRARLYMAAAGSSTEDAPAARAALRALDPSALTADDASLRDAALAVAASVDAAAPDPVASAGDAGAADGPSGPSAAPTLDRARKALAAADASLGSAP